jgi:16S rRNA (cytidine1402-2'-O)-methyltransferase
MEAETKTGKLYLVATPIGNLSDMTFRAVDVLGSVSIVACEDTRHTGKLLKAYEIPAKLVSYHDHNEIERAQELLERLKKGEDVALVSDAGTPGISDPGFRIVRASIDAGIDVVPVPGPAAFVAALSVSGLPTDAIFFGGFLPSRSGERLKRLNELKDIPATLAFYESPQRIVKTLCDCLAVLGDRNAVAARELTKLHEEVRRGRISELLEHFSGAKSRGEFVLLIDRTGETGGPQGGRPSKLIERILELEDSGIDHRSALKQAAKECGLSRSEAYRIFQGYKTEKKDA